MKMNNLGDSGLSVSELCLGSMTWGSQNTQNDAFEQIDHALANGVNFIDTAEMYPVNPVRAERLGRTEDIIGNWFETTNRRGDVVLASKITGPNAIPVRDGEPITKKSIHKALEGSLKRLKTDYIDLYQLHWPNRGSYHFRQNWSYDPSAQHVEKTRDNMLDVIETLDGLVKDGKIRAYGHSNETAWGLTRWAQLARENGWAKSASTQNEYSLMCRVYDTDLAEVTAQENIPLLSYSPLAVGLLTGKYQNGACPEGSRKSLVPELGGRVTDRAFPATQAYLDVAKKHGLDPTQMALAFCIGRPFMASTIFGATTMAQLDCALGSVDLTLSDEVLKDITAAHQAHPMPF
ncbi:MAG: aldo/keto reductase [Halocynthiibacter sp.]